MNQIVPGENSAKSILLEQLNINIKSFADLSKNEKFNLTYLNLGRDGVFHSMLQNLKFGKIEKPENISLATASYGGMIIGWMMIDLANEYNKSPDVCSIMFYTHSMYRGRNIASILFAYQLNTIKYITENGIKICGYAHFGDPAANFFKFLEKKYSIPIFVKVPEFYWSEEDVNQPENRLCSDVSSARSE